MLNVETLTTSLQGSYRDVMTDAAGRVTWDSGWRKNTIRVDCHRLLAALMCGEPSTAGIQGLQVGAGNPQWDQGLPAQPQPTDGLYDTAPYTAPPADLKFSYLDPVTANPSSTGVTNRLQIVVTLPPGFPQWPGDGTPHTSATLREFGLVGMLDNAQVLVNVVRHVAIVKDSTSALVRTIQLVF